MKYRANQLNALLENFDTYEKMLTEFSQGTNSAAEEAEKTANSWEGSLNKFNNSITKLANNFVTSGGAKSIINFFTSVVNGANKVISAFGGMGTAVGVFSTIMLSKSKSIHFSYDEDVKSIKFGETALQNLTGATLKQTAATIGLKAATFALNTALNLGLTLAISGVVSWIDDWINRDEKLKQEHDEIIQKVEESAQKYKEAADNANDYLTTYKEILAKDEITEEDRSKLLEMQNALIDTYGEQAKGIDLVNGKYQEQLDIVSQLTQGEYEKQAIAATQLINDAISATQDNTSRILSYSYNQIDDYSRNNYKTRIGDNSAISSDESGINKLREYRDLLSDIKGLNTAVLKDDVLSDYGTKTYTLGLAEGTTSADAVEALTMALERLYQIPREQRGSLFEDVESRLQNLLQHYQGEVQKLDNLFKDNVQSLVGRVTTETGVNWANVTDETFKEWYNAVLDFYNTDQYSEEYQQAIMDWFDRTYTSISQRLARGTSITDIAYESEKAFKSAMSKAANEVFEFSFSAYAEDVSSVTKEVDTLQGVIDKIDSGKYTTIKDGFGLLESHPELLEYINDTDKLRAKLIELQKSAPKELVDDLKSLREQISKTGNQEQLKQIDSLILALSQLGKTAEQTAESLTTDDYLKIQTNGIDKIIDKLSDEKDAINDTIDTLKDRKTEIQDFYDAQIDALKTENDERERNIELQEKQKALDDAKRNKVIVYSAVRGRTIQEDTEAVAKAQRELDDALSEQQIAELEKKRDAEVSTVDEQIAAQQALITSKQEEIDAWETYKETIKTDTEEIVNYNAAYLEAQKQFVLDENSTFEDRVENLKNYLTAIQNLVNGAVSDNGLSEAGDIFGTTFNGAEILKDQSFPNIFGFTYANMLSDETKSGLGGLEITKGGQSSIYNTSATFNITANKVDDAAIQNYIERYITDQYTKKVVNN